MYLIEHEFEVLQIQYVYDSRCNCMNTHDNVFDIEKFVLNIMLINKYIAHNWSSSFVVNIDIKQIQY